MYIFKKNKIEYPTSIMDNTKMYHMTAHNKSAKCFYDCKTGKKKYISEQ